MLFLIFAIFFHICITYEINPMTDLNEIRKDWYVIVNPNAGNRKGQKDWKRIEELFQREAINTESVFTGRKGEATELTMKAIAAGFRNFIVEFVPRTTASQSFRSAGSLVARI